MTYSLRVLYISYGVGSALLVLTISGQCEGLLAARRATGTGPALFCFTKLLNRDSWVSDDIAMLYQHIAEQNSNANSIRIEEGAHAGVVGKSFSHSITVNGNQQRVTFMHIYGMRSKKSDVSHAARPDHWSINLFC